MEAICKNCEIRLQPNYDYCPKCSQKTKLHRLSLHDVFHEAIHYFTHADKGLFQLIRDLATKKGVVAREFVEGKRKKYFPPLNFFLLIAAFYVFAVNIDGNPAKTDILKENPELNDIADPVKREKMIHLYERRDAILHYIKKYSNMVAMVSLPFTAFLFWLVYRKGRYNYIEHLVAGMYMHGFGTLFLSVLMGLNLIFDFPDNAIYMPFLVFQTVYFAIFYYQFMGDHTTKKAVKAALASTLSTFSMFFVSGMIVFFYMLDLFRG